MMSTGGVRDGGVHCTDDYVFPKFHRNKSTNCRVEMTEVADQLHERYTKTKTVC